MSTPAGRRFAFVVIRALFLAMRAFLTSARKAWLVSVLSSLVCVLTDVMKEHCSWHQFCHYVPWRLNIEEGRLSEGQTYRAHRRDPVPYCAYASYCPGEVCVVQLCISTAAAVFSWRQRDRRWEASKRGVWGWEVCKRRALGNVVMAAPMASLDMGSINVEHQ